MKISGPVLAIREANLDTDRMYPGKYLTTISREGLGGRLFEGLAGGREMLAAHPGATILVTLENLGCGSSREHAVWALVDAGFRAVIAPSFARIFHENCYANGVVPLVLEDPAALEVCLAAPSLEIDVEAQTVSRDGTETARFELDPLRKEFILRGGFMEFLAGKIEGVRSWLAKREPV